MQTHLNCLLVAPYMLGRLTGKVTTHNFVFELQPGAEVRKFEYVKVLHRVYEWVLCQVVEIEVSTQSTLVKCNVLGFRDTQGVKRIRIPFDIGSEVFLADDDFIAAVVELKSEKGAYLGRLDGKTIPVHLDLSKLLTKHVAVLAKSGAGKSYAVGVLIEEILEKKVPVLVIDPHGEYGSLKTAAEKKDMMEKWGISPKGYTVREYGDESQGVAPLRLPGNLTQQELIHLLPGKLNNTQLGILYSAIKGMDQLNFESVQLSLEAEESNAKWSIINLIDHLRTLNIFSAAPIPYNELIKSGSASIINLRGYAPEIQQVICYKLAKDLFELRKVNKVPPFFLVVEEAHNFCPERSFGEATSSKILRTIASEGRKFGLGLCVISQRPARVDKSVLSQCTTQVILKVTNPNDLRAISAGVEGLTAESEAEIQNLSIGTALVTGLVDMPLFVNIRPRRTQHGGDAVDILDQPSFLEQTSQFEEQELLPVLKPQISRKDAELMADGPIEEQLVPGYVFVCKDKETFKLLVEMVDGEVVVNLDEFVTARLPDLRSLSRLQVKILQVAPSLGTFTLDELAEKVGTLDLEDAVSDLVEKEYLADDNGYCLTNRYVLAKLSTYANYGKVEYEKSSAPQLDAGVSLDEIKELLSRFTSVIDHQECFILRYVDAGD